MPNITMTEWQERQAQLSAEVKRRWPWLHKPWSRAESSIRVECHALSASAELRMSGGCFAVDVRVGGSSTCSGNAADVAEFSRQVSEVRDVMLYLHGETRDLVIWADGDCPCGSCGGRGADRGQPCRRCDGKGKR